MNRPGRAGARVGTYGSCRAVLVRQRYSLSLQVATPTQVPTRSARTVPSVDACRVAADSRSTATATMTAKMVTERFRFTVTLRLHAIHDSECLLSDHDDQLEVCGSKLGLQDGSTSLTTRPEKTALSTHVALHEISRSAMGRGGSSH